MLRVVSCVWLFIVDCSLLFVVCCCSFCLLLVGIRRPLFFVRGVFIVRCLLLVGRWLLLVVCGSLPLLVVCRCLLYVVLVVC